MLPPVQFCMMKSKNRCHLQLHSSCELLLKALPTPLAAALRGLVVSNIFGPYDARLLRRSFVHLNQLVTLRVGATSGMLLDTQLGALPEPWGALNLPLACAFFGPGTRSTMVNSPHESAPNHLSPSQTQVDGFIVLGGERDSDFCSVVSFGD